MQTHARLRKKRSRVQIVGIIFYDFSHGIAIFLSRPPPIGFGIGRKTLCHGSDVSLLDRPRVGAAVNSFLDRLDALP